MSKDIIVSKLCQELGQEFVSERQVVYVLAETRKILEVTRSEEKYPEPEILLRLGSSYHYEPQKRTGGPQDFRRGARAGHERRQTG